MLGNATHQSLDFIIVPSNLQNFKGGNEVYRSLDFVIVPGDLQNLKFGNDVCQSLDFVIGSSVWKDDCIQRTARDKNSRCIRRSSF